MGAHTNAGWDEKLARLAARISVNRVIAGVHFPVDLAAGLVLGLAVGRYFVALAKGKTRTQSARAPKYGIEVVHLSAGTTRSASFRGQLTPGLGGIPLGEHS